MASSSSVEKIANLKISSSLSKRGLRYKSIEQPLLKTLLRYVQNKYDKVKNPAGIVNLGTSENKLLSDIVLPKLNEHLEVKDEHTHYFAFSGSPRFRKIISEFLEYYMKPVEKINPDHVTASKIAGNYEIIAFNGCGSVVKCLGSVLCDPGEGILIPTPFYGGFDSDLSIEPEVIRFPVHLQSKPNPETNAPFDLTLEDLEESLAKANKQNIRIRALILCHPHNPLGTIYSEKQIRQCMEFAEKHSLHLISDEIYMLSIFKEGCSMTSALAITSPPVDPDRLHIIWGFSKDFGMSGLRAGVIYSRNVEILQALRALEYFYGIPALLQDTLGNFISDREWLDNTLIPTNYKRLRECHHIVSEALKGIGVPIVEGCAGLYVWVDLRSFVNPRTFEMEQTLSDTLLDNGVYINAGRVFNCVEPGWFRIVIASDSDIVKVGIQRMVRILGNIKTNHSS